MKRFFLSIGLACAAMMVSSCVVDPYHPGPPPPHHRPGGGYSDRIYNDGYNDGVRDRRSGRRYDADSGARRYSSSNERSIYRNGYAAGWRNTSGGGGRPPGGDYGDARARAYNEGARDGANDRGRGRRYDPYRHTGDVSPQLRETFVRGYSDGYYRRR